MGQIEEFKINPLPSITWNWLRLNDVNVKWNMDIEPCNIEIKEDNNEKAKDADIWGDIKTGAGEAADVIFAGENGKANVAALSFGNSDNTEAADSNSGVCEKVVHVDITSNKVSFAGVLKIHGKENSSVSVIETFGKGGNGSIAFRTLVQAEKNSRVRLVQIFLEDQTLLNDVGCVCEENADFEVLQIFAGKGNLYNGIRTDLKGDKAHTEKSIGYLGQNKQVVDINLVINHLGKKTGSEIQVDGTLKDEAEKTFRGTIDFKNGSSQSVGAETENVLLLGDNVVNKTIPVILCAEEDVEGSHGATIGELDEETMFYFASRGIDQELAEDIMTKGKMEVLYRKINDEVTEKLVEEQLAEVMGYDREEL